VLHLESAKEKRVEKAVEIAARVHLNEPGGDVLAFLTGFEECEMATSMCYKKLEYPEDTGELPQDHFRNEYRRDLANCREHRVCDRFWVREAKGGVQP
jgi:HrpA-like RNA helicase